jgi:hypothetical protein
MKIDKFELIEIINESINEILDFKNINNYEYNYYGGNPLIGEFKLDDEANVKVLQQKINPISLKIPPVFNIDNGIINLVFSIDGITAQYKKTTFKEFVKILKTIVLIIGEFISLNSDKKIVYILHAESKIENEYILSDRQKREIYKMILSRQLNGEYRISDAIFGNDIPVIAFQKLK